jgi:hypothetical protein
MLNTKTSKSLKTAWESRWSGNLESTLKLVPELSSELGFQLFGIETHTSEKEWQKNGISIREGLLKSDAILLSASILRLQGKLELTQTAIERAQEVLLSAGLLGSFRFHFERGLLQFVQGYFLTALDDFFAAERMTEEPLFRLISLSNALFCLENVGIGHENVLMEIKTLQKKLEKSSHPVYKANEKQLLAYQMRSQARAGSFRAALALNNQKEFRVQDQSSFYARYLSLLPYSILYKPITKHETELLLKEPETFYQKGYLIRTLLGYTHANDAEIIKLSDRIDRLYLWTWNWLQAPTSFGTDRLISALNEVLKNYNPNLTTLEDQALLRNALGWLSLIDPSLQIQMLKLNSDLVRAAGHFPLFDFEWTLVQLLKAKKENQVVKAKDTLVQIKLHPLWNSKEILLKNLILESKHPIAARILEPECEFVEKKHETEFRIDLNTYTIEDLKSGTRIISQSLSRALRCLYESKTIRCEDFAEQVFDIRRYDSFIHLPKINNLLARMKKFFHGKVTIHVRAGIISFQEHEPYRIQWVQATKLTSLLRSESQRIQSPEINQSTSTKAGLTFGMLLGSLGQKAAFSRDEAEQALKKSKSSVNRFLDLLIRRKVIQRSGHGRSTTYHFLRTQEIKI